MSEQSPSPAMTEAEQVEQKRACWHSRRGMLELDVLLLPFAEQAFGKLSRDDKDAYLALLECEDPDLFLWFLEHQPVADERLARAVELVRDFKRSQKRS